MSPSKKKKIKKTFFREKCFSEIINDCTRFFLEIKYGCTKNSEEEVPVFVFAFILLVSYDPAPLVELPRVVVAGFVAVRLSVGVGGVGTVLVVLGVGA